jgi:hypothetical protein
MQKKMVVMTWVCPPQSTLLGLCSFLSALENFIDDGEVESDDVPRENSYHLLLRRMQDERVGGMVVDPRASSVDSGKAEGTENTPEGVLTRHDLVAHLRLWRVRVKVRVQPCFYPRATCTH